jgi:hypothetical protein
MSSQWVDFAAIKRSVDIEQVLDHYRVRLKRVRKDYLRGLCPLPTHGSGQSRVSFGVDTGRNVWACHSASCCQARQGQVGGNILDLVACMEACSVREAALRLRTWSDASGEIGLPDQLVSKGKRADRSQEELPRLSFTLRLQWHPYLEQRGIRWQTAAWFGAGYYGGSGFLRGRMVFPIHDERGQLVAYAGRRMAGASDRQSELLDTYFRELVVMLDGDAAGRRASRVLAGRWPAASMAWVPAGWQPDQLSSEAIERILRSASGAPGA